MKVTCVLSSYHAWLYCRALACDDCLYDALMKFKLGPILMNIKLTINKMASTTIFSTRINCVSILNFVNSSPSHPYLVCMCS